METDRQAQNRRAQVALASLYPGSVRVVNRQGMLWGDCLGVEPNTRHI